MLVSISLVLRAAFGSFLAPECFRLKSRYARLACSAHAREAMDDLDFDLLQAKVLGAESSRLIAQGQAFLRQEGVSSGSTCKAWLA